MIEFKSKEKVFKNNEFFHVFKAYCKNKDFISWPLHGHEFFELELFTDGHGYQILNGERHEIKKGSLHLLTTSDFHQMEWKHDIKQIGVCFDQSKIDKKLVEKIFSTGHTLVCDLEGEEYEKMYRIMTMIHEYYCDENAPMKLLFVKNMLESAIILLLKMFIPREEEKTSNRNHIQQAIAYLEMNFKNDPSLEEVAEYVGLNKNYFSTIFSKATGKPFVKYVIDLKLEYSKNLIRSSSMTMSEICYSSGFRSFSNFAREFKKKFNRTPLQYRKK